MPEVFVAAGGNVRPRAQLRKALALLRESWPGMRTSTAYANAAVGFDGPDFVNLVVAFDTDWPLPAVLERLHAIEAACGRARAAPKWASRSMDLDVLLYGGEVGEFPGATLPRPDLLQRAYMLGPLAELAPAHRHPVLGRSFSELWADFTGGPHPMTPALLDDPD